ncbi:MAG TPA: zf-HC2 domain-containing protein [Pyrinomonadaceae bacterium]|nr:zf-HC2 domain-containing protein [Pyrinomonadaceae bacterium]
MKRVGGSDDALTHESAGATLSAAVGHTSPPCAQTGVTAGYLDGELDAQAAGVFERHLKDCATCAAALSEQRRLLCLLDAAFDETFERKLALPKDFTRVVRARAQTDMSGVRSGRERATALKICAALAAATSVLLGATLSESVFAPVAAAGSGAAGVAGMAGHAVADAGAGGVVVLRAVGGRLLAETNFFGVFTWAIFAGAILLLMLLIRRYHRRADLND